MIKNWNQRRFLAQVSGRVADNLYRACEYAADEARRLAPRRTGRIVRGIDISVEVTARNQTIEGRVGVRKPVYWAYFQEVGTRHHAAQPFLRPAVFGNAKRIVRMIEGKE